MLLQILSRNYLVIDINFGRNETGAQAYRKVKAAKANNIIVIQVMLGQCLLYWYNNKLLLSIELLCDHVRFPFLTK